MPERLSHSAFGAAAMHLRRAAGSAVLCALACWPGGFAAAAEVYKCVDNGRIVYQDYACRGPGSVVPMERTPAPSPSAAADETARLKARLAELEQARKARETTAEIQGIEREIQGYEEAEQGELSALREKQGYANYNLPGAVWERGWVLQGIEKEMQAVTERYAALKQAARDRIEKLRKASESKQPAP